MNAITKLWLDESGDAGFKFGKGSSQFLVIAAVYLVDSNSKIDFVEDAVEKLKSKLRITQNYEFKFSRCKDKFKIEFLRIISKLPLEYKAIVVDKKRLKQSPFRSRPRELYCELIRRLLYDNNPPLEKAILVIDEAAAKIHHKEFNAVLKQYLSKNVVRRVRQNRSQSNVMIQVADMIAGSIFRKLKRKDNSYYQIANKKEKILIKF